MPNLNANKVNGWLKPIGIANIIRRALFRVMLVNNRCLESQQPEIRLRQTISRPPVYRITLIQIALTLLCSLLFLMRSQDAAISALAGGLICAIPNAYFIYKAFLYTGARQVEHVLQSFYQGGTWKMVLTGIGFAAAFKLIQPLDFLALFVTFVVVQCVNVFVSKIAKI